MYARAEVLDQVDYSLNVSKQCMAFFKDFFGIAYPLPKSGAFLLKLNERALSKSQSWQGQTGHFENAAGFSVGFAGRASPV